jgi:hypothetical protein
MFSTGPCRLSIAHEIEVKKWRDGRQFNYYISPLHFCNSISIGFIELFVYTQGFVVGMVCTYFLLVNVSLHLFSIWPASCTLCYLMLHMCCVYIIRWVYSSREETLERCTHIIDERLIESGVYSIFQFLRHFDVQFDLFLCIWPAVERE